MSKRQELFERLRNVGFRAQSLAGIVQNEVPNYPKEQVDEWNRLIQECVDELFHLKAEVNMFLIRDNLKS